MDTPHHLRAVIAIAETGSITAAARTLGISQPGLSRTLDKLEDELGANLFIRGRRGAELTSDGRKLLEFARNTLTEYELLRAAMSNSRSGAGSSPGALKVVASTTPGEYLLPALASQFARLHRDIPVETLITDSASVARLLASGEFEVGFAGQALAFSSLKFVKIATDEVVLAVPVSHSFATTDEVDVSALDGETMLRRESGSGTYSVVESVLGEHGMQLPDEPGLVLGSTQAIVSAVDSGLGIGFVTLRAIKHHAPSRVAAVRISGVPIMRDLFMVYGPVQDLSTSARTFIEFVENGSTAPVS